MSYKILVLTDRLQESHRQMILDTCAPYGHEVVFRSDPSACGDVLPGVQIIYAGDAASLIPEAPKLEWICTCWAGVEEYCRPGVIPDGVLLTNASGAYGVTLAEHAVMTTLMLLRHQMWFDDHMRAGQWTGPVEHGTIAGSRVTLLGAGDVGQRIAERLREFLPSRITAVSRSGRTDADCFDSIVPQSELASVLPGTDILIMSLPSTPETAGILNREMIALLPETSVIVNVGRGSTIDEEALVEALNSGKIAGAALDVMKHEPLPEDDPLWTAKNILLTPHVAGNMTAPYTRWKNVSMFCEDIVNFSEGRPLRHLVDVRAGY